MYHLSLFHFNKFEHAAAWLERKRNVANVNPLSPPCIPPKFVLHGLSSKSKFLAVENIARRGGFILPTLIRDETDLRHSNKNNPLSPPCIPPKFVLHGLSSKSKFLAV